VRTLRPSSPQMLALTCAAILSLVSACSRSSPELQLLRQEKIATAQIPGTDDGATLESKGGTTFGKPTTALLTRQLPIKAGVNPQEVLATAVRTARGDGWTTEDGPPAAGGAWLLRKTVNDQHLELGASVQQVDGRPTLVLNLSNLR
jgi:hypothetical protein